LRDSDRFFIGCKKALELAVEFVGSEMCKNRPCAALYT
jgi:hypothetical protein